MGRPKAPCGTDAAYRRHLRNGEPVDDACRQAHTEAQRERRRSPAATPTASAEIEVPAEASGDADDGDDMKLIVDTLRTAFKTVAKKDPTKLAPIAREFRTAVVEASRAGDAPKELSLADQLAAARAARAARAQGQGATS
ncbi:hypothetical protein [Microbacterium stercoris]|uniref:Uncharacterized protein n=1 Tax=Microbacterium stercoris TaxID=2820289 RepID=A0A939QIY5_9MICO|nr:hypothetical protein [Microbacterium stercoris]MBO3663723.1 hypothetical protein [Microbacterium stercoris]